MRALLIASFSFIWITPVSAQFGNTPQILTQSTNANQLDIWTADLDADGDADLLSAQLNSLIWYENDGAGHFSNDHELMTARMSNSIGFLGGAFEDLNGDGQGDLVFGQAWRRGLGSGQFAPQATVLTNPLASLCDVDGDGRPDAITRDNSKIFWQRNLGSGSFAAQQVLFTGAQPEVYNLKIDLNADGRDDFIARHNNAAFWHKNIGNNQFDTVRLISKLPLTLLPGKLDPNDKPDLLICVDGKIFWYEFDTDGTRTLRQTLLQYYSGDLSLGDLDADGDRDLFVSDLGVAGSHRTKYFSFNTNTGQFDPAPKSPNSSLLGYYYAEIVDLNGDTRPDILVGGISGGYQLGYLGNLAPGSFSGFTNINKKLALPQEIEIADLENDGDMDIFAVGIVLENLGGAQYAEKRPANPGVGSRAFWGDLDGDGVKDQALPFRDSIAWRKGLGNGQFAPPQLIPGLVTSCKQVGGGDLDNDGDLDLFAANGTDALAANARFYWFENDGKGHFTEHLLETNIQFCAGALAVDVNEDGLTDMGLLFFNGYAPRLYLNLGGGVFAQPTALFPAGKPSPSNVQQDLFSDLDGDGRTDYICSIRGFTLTKVVWYQNLGPAGFSAEKTLATISHQGVYSTPYFCIFDADSDGLTDVVVSDNYWNRFLWVRGRGNSSFAAAVSVYDEPNYGNFYAVAAHDVDGDGKLDLVYGSDSDYLGNLNGYNRLSWLKNTSPAPVSSVQTVFQNSTCSDNGTPLEADDDRIVLRFKVIPTGDAGALGRFTLFDENTQTPLDTFYYGVASAYTFPPGFAGLNLFTQYSFRDLGNPLWKKTFNLPVSGTCSPNAPPVIGLPYFKASCDDAGTPTDPTDDRVRLEMAAAKYNSNPVYSYYTLQSNLGAPANAFDESNVGLYLFPEVFWLPDGSASKPGKISLSLRDSQDSSLVKMYVFENPGVCPSVPPPCPKEISYNKQRQIDLFPDTYPNCRVIEGSVILKQSALPDAAPIENLNGLAGLDIIRGNLEIRKTSLENLQGLQGLDSIGGDFYLFENAQLQEIKGLAQLKTIGGQVALHDLPALQSLDGLDTLNHIGAGLYLEKLPALESLQALQQLQSIPSTLWLYQCDHLTSLQGLHHITDIGAKQDIISGYLSIVGCHSLEHLTGLEALRSVYHLNIEDNTGLKDLTGLEHLDSIRLNFILLNNPALQNLNALAGVKSAIQENIALHNNDALEDLSGIGNMDLSALDKLAITGSRSLAACAQPNICAYLARGGAAQIDSNHFGCNSPVEVQSTCRLPLTALLSGGGAVCAGDTAYISIAFSGEGPYTFVWTRNGVPQAPVNTGENPYVLAFVPGNNTLFGLQSVSNAQGVGLAGGSAGVNVLPLPQVAIAAPDTICLGDTISLKASGGLQYVWSSGQTGAQIDVPVTTAAQYTVTVLDAQNCRASATRTLIPTDCTSGVFSPEKVDFQAFPNPLGAEQTLNISLDALFSGKIKLEIIALDGLLLQTTNVSKTDKAPLHWRLPVPYAGPFFIRVSDEKYSAVQLVLRF